MSKVCIAASGVFSLALAVSLPAAGAEPGRVALSVERLFGVSRISLETQLEGLPAQSETVTSVSVFGSPFLGAAYTSPRLAVDYIADFGLSVGAGMGYQHITTSSSNDAGADDDDDAISAFVAAPRVGYLSLVTPQVALWPRGGVTYRYLGFGEDTSTSFTAISAELPLVLMLAEGHVGLFAMPHIDYGVAGSNDSFDQNVDQTATEFGLQFGLSVFL